MPSTTVVIADDHPIFRRGLREAIDSDGGFQVVAETSDGLATLAALRKHRPGLAVLDISMPSIDGLDVLAQTRTWPDPPAIVLLTMHDKYIDRALELGARGYLLKENAEEELVACLHAVARGGTYLGQGVTPRGAPAATGPLAALTPTERRILKLLGDLKTSKQIGEIMCISHRTVQNHCANMSAKLGLRGSKALLRFALTHRGDV